LSETHNTLQHLLGDKQHQHQQNHILVITILIMDPNLLLLRILVSFLSLIVITYNKCIFTMLLIPHHCPHGSVVRVEWSEFDPFGQRGSWSSWPSVSN